MTLPVSPDAEITVTRHSGCDGMADIRKDWLALEAATIDPDTSFQSFAWCAAWVAAHCAGDDPVHEPLILIARHDGQAVALLPLMRRRFAGLDFITILGAPHSQVANALALPDALGEAGIAACADALGEIEGGDILRLAPLSGASVLAGCFDERTLPDAAETLSVKDCRPFDTGADYIAGLSKNRRRDYRRKLAKLADGGTVDLRHIVPGDADFAHLLALALRLKRDWLHDNGMVSLGLSGSEVDAFFEELATPRGLRERIELDVLQVGDRPICIALNLVTPHQRDCYLCAYDPDFHAASPGTLMHQMGIQKTIDEGRDAYSLLGHPTTFKRTWTDIAVPLMRYERARTWRGRVYLSLWSHRLRPLAKRSVGAVGAAVARLRMAKKL